MQGRRTFLIAAIVALVAACSTAGITFLHLHADEQQSRYEQLIDLEADANRLDALESEANAQRRVPLAAQAEVMTLLRDMHLELADLARPPDGRRRRRARRSSTSTGRRSSRSSR